MFALIFAFSSMQFLPMGYNFKKKKKTQLIFNSLLLISGLVHSYTHRHTDTNTDTHIDINRQTYTHIERPRERESEREQFAFPQHQSAPRHFEFLPPTQGT